MFNNILKYTFCCNKKETPFLDKDKYFVARTKCSDVFRVSLRVSV